MSLLQDFADDLTADGYAVERVAKQAVEEKVGYVTVNAPVVITDSEFEGHMIVNVYEDHVEDHGVDIHSKNDHRFPESKKSLLDEVASSRTQLGDDWTTWTYYSRPDVEDNISDLVSTFDETFQRVR